VIEEAIEVGVGDRAGAVGKLGGAVRVVPVDRRDLHALDRARGPGVRVADVAAAN